LNSRIVKFRFISLQLQLQESIPPPINVMTHLFQMTYSLRKFALVTSLEVNASINMINTTVAITAFIVLCNASVHVRNEIHFEELDVELSYKINRAWFGMAIFRTERIRYLISRNTGYNVFVYLLGQSI